jgi:membrane protein DedA with SNARE-associated domain
VADRLLDWLAGLPTGPTYAVLMLLSAAENVFPPVPADVAVALGAFLAARGEVHAWLLGVLCWLANSASSAGVYWAARRHEAAFRAGWGARLIPGPAMAAIDRAYRRHGALGIFLTRFLPGFRATVLPFAGLSGVGPVRALAPACAASAIWYAFLIEAGRLVGGRFPAVKALIEDVNLALGALALVVALVVVAWLRRASREA